jgi:hypothetical protein
VLLGELPLPIRPAPMVLAVLIDLAAASLGSRVARWFLFKPKIQNLGKFWKVFQW